MKNSRIYVFKLCVSSAIHYVKFILMKDIYSDVKNH